MATMADSRVILDQNSAEELTPPGQAILVRGVEAVRVMPPFLSGEERRQRLAALQAGQVTLTQAGGRVLQAARDLLQQNQSPTTRATYAAWRRQVAQKRVVAALRHLREMGLLAEAAPAAPAADALQRCSPAALHAAHILKNSRTGAMDKPQIDETLIDEAQIEAPRQPLDDLPLAGRLGDWPSAARDWLPPAHAISRPVGLWTTIPTPHLPHPHQRPEPRILPNTLKIRIPRRPLP